MFCYNSEMIIIGSNTKKRASPRVGSLARVYRVVPYPIENILNKDKKQAFPNMQKALSLVQINAVFIRYGYGEKYRFEPRTVRVLVPKVKLGANSNKTVKRLISFVNSLSVEEYGEMVVVAPVVSDNANSLLAELLLKLTSKNVRSLARFIGTNKKEFMFFDNNTDDTKKDGYYKVTNMNNICPRIIRPLIFDVGNHIPLKTMYDKWSYLIINNKKGIRDSLDFLYKQKVMDHRFELANKRKHKFKKLGIRRSNLGDSKKNSYLPWDYQQVVSSKLFIYDQLSNYWFKFREDEFEKVLDLQQEFVKEGKKVLTQHSY